MKKVIVLFVSLWLFLNLCPFPGVAQTSYTSKNTGDWTGVNTWDKTGTPGSIDTANITPGYTVSLPSGGGDQVIGTLNLNGGNLSGPAALTINSGGYWSGGNISGQLNLLVSGTFNITSDKGNSGDRALYGTLENSGTINQNISGAYLRLYSATIDNKATGVWNLQNDNSIYSNSGSPVFNNEGTFVKSTGTGTSTIYPFFKNMAGGVIDVRTGTLTLAGGSSTVDGNEFKVKAGATLDLPNHTFTGTQTAFGGGSVLVKNVTLGAGGATFAFSDANMLFWTGGNIVTGTDTLKNTGIFNITSDKGNSGDRALYGTLENSGTINQNISGAYLRLYSATINNKATGVWNLQNDNDIYANSGSPVFNNEGTFVKLTGTGTSTIYPFFKNMAGGVIDVRTGTLTLAGGSSTVDGNEFKVKAGATLDLPNHTFTGTQTAFGGGSVLVKNVTLGAGGATFAFPSTTKVYWTGGNIVTGTDTLKNTGIFNITSDKGNSGDRALYGTLENSGTINQNISGAYLRLYGATINNKATGVWNLQNDNSIYSNSGSPVFNNEGTFVKLTGTGTSTIYPFFKNMAGGVIDVRTGTLTLAGGSSTVDGNEFKVKAGATLDLPNHTFTGTQTAFGGGSVLVKNVTLGAGGATFAFSDANMLFWTGGNIVTGTDTLKNTGIFNITSDKGNSGDRALYGTLENSGTINQNISGAYLRLYSATINNKATGVWNLQNDNDIYANSGSPVFNNEGTFVKLTGTGTSTIYPFFKNMAGGVIDVRTGTLTLAGGSSTVDGNEFKVKAGATLDLPNHTFTGTQTAFGGGSVLVKNVTLGAGGATFAFPSTTKVYWTGGNIVTGTDTLKNTGIFNITSDKGNSGDRALYGTLENSGTINQNISGAYLRLYGATINNKATGVWNLQNDNSIYSNSGSPVFNNEGTFVKSTGTGTSTIQPLFTNKGTVDIRTGTLDFSNNYTQTGSAAVTTVTGTLAAPRVDIQGGVLRGTGTVQGTVTNSGTVAPGNSPGLLTINGTYTQTAGELAIEILKATTAGSTYDQLYIKGTATLGGALHVSLLSGATVNDGETFTILHSDRGLSGAFDSYLGYFDTSKPFYFTASYTTYDVILTAHGSSVPLPPSVLLLGGGLASLAGLRFRRKRA